MCEISEKWYTEGRKEGKMEQAKETAYALADRKMTPETISEIIQVSLSTVKQWLADRPITAR